MQKEMGRGLKKNSSTLLFVPIDVLVFIFLSYCKSYLKTMRLSGKIMEKTIVCFEPEWLVNEHRLESGEEFRNG